MYLYMRNKCCEYISCRYFYYIDVNLVFIGIYIAVICQRKSFNFRNAVI